MNYNKPPISIAQQIERLKKRGLNFNDEERAAHYLSNISYYRLRAYTYPFQDNFNPQHPFIVQISFEEIIQLYVFDRKLRMLVFNALEKIEVALRTKIINEFSHGSGSHWHEDATLYRDQHFFHKNIQSLYEEIDRSSEAFIHHYKAKYSNPEYPPAWMSLEVVSMGLLSKLYLNLKKCKAKINVAKAFGLPKLEIMESWIHAFATVRNICAHHGRLWNRRFTISPKLPYNPKRPFLKNLNIDDKKLYAQLSCINYALKEISPDCRFVNDLKELIHSCPMVKLKDMGFPENWEEEALWK